MNCQFETISENKHKCKNCGFEITIEQSPDKIFRSCIKIEQNTSFPSAYQQIKNAISSTVQHVQDGLAHVNDEEKNRRMDICQKCEHYDGSRCKLCGCFCNTKTAWRSERCPINKW